MKLSDLTIKINLLPLLKLFLIKKNFSKLHEFYYSLKVKNKK